MDSYNRIQDGKYDLGSPSPYSAFTSYSNRLRQIEPYSYTAGKDFAFREPETDSYPSLYGTLPGQIFGRDIRQAGLSVERLYQMLYERSGLHRDCLRDIDHRHMKCQEELFGLKLCSPDHDGRRWAGLEGMLAQLESERRREDLAFWKDSAEIRSAIWEKQWDYEKAKSRADTLGSLMPDSLGAENA